MLEWNPTNKDGRKALGYEPLPTGGWATKPEIELRAQLRAIPSKAPGQKALTEEQGYEKALSIPMKKRTSDHFVVSSPHLEAPVLESLDRHCEHTYAMWDKLFSGGDVFQVDDEPRSRRADVF